MCVFRAQAVKTIRVRCLSGLLEGHAEDFNNRVLEHEDPAYLRPVEARLGFFGRFDGGEGVIVECAGWCRILYEQEKEGAVLC